jgi:hypothetical protein
MLPCRKMILSLWVCTTVWNCVCVCVLWYLCACVWVCVCVWYSLCVVCVWYVCMWCVYMFCTCVSGGCIMCVCLCSRCVYVNVRCVCMLATGWENGFSKSLLKLFRIMVFMQKVECTHKSTQPIFKFRFYSLTSFRSCMIYVSCSAQRLLLLKLTSS